jgi:hypothetical protein
VTLLLLGTALAHTPHDTTTFVAVEDGRVLTDVSRTPEVLLAESSDGWTWTYERWWGTAPPTDGALLDGERWVADGDLYREHELVLEGVTEVQAFEGQLWAAGAEGLFVDGERKNGGGYVALDVPCAATLHNVACGNQGFEEVDHEIVDLLAEEGPWLATDGGGLLRWDEDAWVRVEGPGDQVSTIDRAGGLWIATEFADLVWTSTDGDTWSSSTPLPETEEGPGNPPDGRHTFGVVEQHGSLFWMATWEGALRSEDGRIWTEAQVVPPSVHRAVAWDGDAVLLGSYGAGLNRVEDGQFEALSSGSLAAFVRQAAVTSEGAWFTERGRLWRQGWERVEAFDDVTALHVHEDQLYAAGASGVWSVEPTELLFELGSDAAGLTVHQGRLFALAEDGRMLADGEELDALPATPTGLWSVDGELLAGSDDGVWRWDEGWTQQGHEGAWISGIAEDMVLADDVLYLASDALGTFPGATGLARSGDRALISSYGGAFLDDGTLASNRLVLDGLLFEIDGSSTVASDPQANRQALTLLADGTATLRFSGDQVRFHGSGEASVDDRPLEGCMELGPGFHTLVVSAPASIDAVEIHLGEGLARPLCEEPGDSADSGTPGDPEGRCGGCATGPASSAAWLLALLAFRRRHQR